MAGGPTKRPPNHPTDIYMHTIQHLLYYSKFSLRSYLRFLWWGTTLTPTTSFLRLPWAPPSYTTFFRNSMMMKLLLLLLLLLLFLLILQLV